MSATRGGRLSASSGPQRVVCVVGSHRTGTSALAHSLQLLGIHLGRDLMPGNADNPRGYWENPHFVAINDAVLATADRDLDSLAPCPLSLDDRSVLALLQQAIERITKQFSKAGLWGFKDPRTSRVLPFWLRTFEELSIEPGFVIAVRDPRSTAASMQRRQRIFRKTEGLSDARALEMWFQYTLDAIEGTEGYPRVVVGYEQLLTSPGTQLQRIARALDLTIGSDDPLDAQARAIVEPSLDHHRTVPDSATPLRPSIATLWSLCQGLADDTMSFIDEAVRHQVGRLAAGRSDVVPLLIALDSADAGASRLASGTSEADSELPGAELRKRVAQLEGELADSDARLADARRRVAEANGLRDQMSKKVADSAARLSISEGALTTERTRLTLAQAQLAEAQKRAAQSRWELAAAQTHVGGGPSNVRQVDGPHLDALLTDPSAEIEARAGLLDHRVEDGLPGLAEALELKLRAERDRDVWEEHQARIEAALRWRRAVGTPGAANAHSSNGTTNENSVIGSLDVPRPNEEVPRGLVTALGWVIDPTQTLRDVILSVSGAQGRAMLGRPRPDIAEGYASRTDLDRSALELSGWEADIDLRGIDGDQADIAAHARHADGSLIPLGKVTVRLGPARPTRRRLLVRGEIEAPSNEQTAAPGQLSVSGWYCDERGPAAAVVVTVDGQALALAELGFLRPDISVDIPHLRHAKVSGIVL